jgi:hypothetical protein
MDLPAFTAAVEAELHARHPGTTLERRALLDSPQDEWPRLQDNPDSARWATAFVKRVRVVEKARDGGGPVYPHGMPRAR